MTEEPYRWLEAIANRREYIRDQLKGATPVFAFSRPEGVLVFGVGSGNSKVFEIYDRHALAVLGHPVDIEKIRQALIESAHLEGFTRAPEDVSVRRLLSFALGPALKSAYEQIFAAPLIIECIFAEVGITPAEDVLARVSFDGTHRLETGGVAVAHVTLAEETAARDWLKRQITASSSTDDVLRAAFAAWKALSDGKASFPDAVPEGLLNVEGRVLEMALLDRGSAKRARYKALVPAAVAKG